MKHAIAPGTRYGKLTFVETVPTPKYMRQSDKYGRFVCDCGTSKPARISLVVNGKTRSCGCAGKEANRAWMRAHYAEANGKNKTKWAAK